MARSTQPKGRGIRMNWRSVTMGSHAMNLAMAYATAAARLPARANGTVRPSALPITMSRMVSLPEKCVSMCCMLLEIG